MTRALLFLALLAGAGCAHAATNQYRALRDIAEVTAEVRASLAAPACTLRWSMPTTLADGRVLSTAPLDWQAAYSTQSDTYVAHEFWIENDADSAAHYWPTVVAEAAPLPVAMGTARPGDVVLWPALPVMSWDWPFSYWIRTRQRPNGNWSLWSNPVTRASND